MAVEELSRDRVLFRRTNAKKGRHLSVTPATSATRHLSYGRIVLDREVPAVRIAASPDEVGLVCLAGQAKAVVNSLSYQLQRYDALYVPRDLGIDISSTSQADLVELRAPVEHHYPLRHVRFAEVSKDPGLHFKTGGPSTGRTITILLGKNIEAGRIVAGVTTSEPGHWTSWPPHEHTALLEEVYAFYDMPAPAFAVQFVYTNTEDPERIEVVRDGDVMVMPAGFHPNVSIPGHTVSFVWMMAAHREVEDRLFGVVNVQPEFADTPSGLDAGKK